MTLKMIKASKWTDVIITIFLVIFAAITSALSEDSLCKENSIGNFYLEAAAESLNRLGMPFPLDTAGWHSFLNRKEKVVCRFRLKKKWNRWVISSIHLLNQEVVSENYFLEDHFMLAGTSLKNFSTGKKLSLELSKEETMKIYGTPDNKFNIGKVEEWFYYNYPGKNKSSLVISFHGDKVISILVEGDF